MKNGLQIATPVSHLFRDENAAKRIAALSDCLECRDRTAKIDFGYQKLFHSDIEPTHVWGDHEFEYFKMIAKNKKHLEYLTFHVACCAKKPVEVNRMYASSDQCYSRNELKENARNNFNWLRSIFDKKIIFAIENNNYYPTNAYDHVTEGSFLRELIDENDLYLLYDLAHSKVTAHNTNVPFNKYFESLPLERVIQFHLSHSKPAKTGEIMFDDHEEIVEDDWLDLEKMINKLPHLKFITIEYYKDENRLLGMLKQLREMIEK